MDDLGLSAKVEMDKLLIYKRLQYININIHSFL